MQLTILGCGTSIGVPVIGCKCPVCSGGKPRNMRTRASISVKLDNGKRILIDTPPDLRQQLLRHDITKVDALFYTHMHADHTHGIDELRCLNYLMRRPVDVYAAPRHIKHLKTHFDYIFQSGGQKGGGRPKLTTHAITPGKGFELFGEKITPLRLWHGRLLCVGWRIGPLAYLTDVSRIDAESYPLLKGVRFVIIDALRLEEHSTHFNLEQALQEIEKIKPERAVITHMSHNIDYYEHSKLLPAKVEFAYDGLSFNIGKKTIRRLPEPPR